MVIMEEKKLNVEICSSGLTTLDSCSSDRNKLLMLLHMWGMFQLFTVCVDLVCFRILENAFWLLLTSGNSTRMQDFYFVIESCYVVETFA